MGLRGTITVDLYFHQRGFYFHQCSLLLLQGLGEEGERSLLLPKLSQFSVLMSSCCLRCGDVVML
jgi:hypothetical protein